MRVCVCAHACRQHDYKQTAKRKRIYVIKKTTWNRNEKKKKKHNHNKNEKNSSCGVSSVWSFKRIRQLELLLPPPPNRVGGNKTTMCCDDDEEEEIVFFITFSQKINERTNGYAAQVKKLSQEVRVRTLEILFVRRCNQIYCLQKKQQYFIKNSNTLNFKLNKKRRQKLSTYT